MANFSKKSEALWLQFFETAQKVLNKKPWAQFNELDLVGVKDPMSDAVAWNSCMGTKGQHEAVVIYKNQSGLDSFKRIYGLAQSEDYSGPRGLNSVLTTFLQDCWSVSLEQKKNVPPWCWDLYKKLGLKFPKGKYIVVQTMEPGWYPELVAEEDLPFIIHNLERVDDAYERFMENPSLRDEDDYFLPFYTPTTKGNLVDWSFSLGNEEDVLNFFEVDEPQHEPSDIFIREALALPKINREISLGLLMPLAAAMEHENGRNFIPIVFVVSDIKVGTILSFDVMAYQDLINSIEMTLLNLFRELGGRPHALISHFTPFLDYIGLIAQETEIDLGITDEPTEMMDFFRHALKTMN